MIEAGKVRRFHIVPLINHYDVAQHSWGMAILLQMLHPDPSIDLTWAVLSHDIHERYTGDVPYTAKLMSPDLKAGLSLMERSVENQLGIRMELTEEEAAWLKALDMLELFLFCDHEYNMGNRNVEAPRDVCRKYLLDTNGVPDEVRGFIDQYEWRRTPDVI